MNLVGTTLGQFQITEELGRGGMATVYKAYQPNLQRHVAIKVLLPSLAQDMDVVKRFLREAQTAAALRHPHVIAIYDVGSEDEIHYIVAEYLEGLTLAHLLEQDGALSLERVLHIVRQVADALDYAHARGFIHRDIKPSNIMVDPGRDDHVTLMDFGLVQVAGGSRITRSGYIVGTPDYMSPEQAKSDVIDQRTDVYSLGVTTFHMLTGNVPFARPTPHAVLLAHVQEEPPSMTGLGRQTPLEVEAVVLKSMAKDPQDRYDWASDMANDLETAITGIFPVDAVRRAPLPAPRVSPPASEPLSDRPVSTAPAGVVPPAQTPPLSPLVASSPSGATTSPARESPPGAPPRPARRRWLWPVLGIVVTGMLVITILACAVGAPFVARWARGAPTATVFPTPSPHPTATLVPTVTATATAPPSLTPTAEPTSTPSAGLVATSTPKPGIKIDLGPDKLLYEEDFTSAGSEWETTASEEVEYQVQGGVFSIAVLKENWIAWNLIGPEFSDFEFEVEVALVEGDTYNDAGLLFRFQDADNYYELDINGQGNYAIGKEVGDEWVQIVDWTSDPAIQPFGEVNHVRLVAKGGAFTLYVNDHYITEFTDTSFSTGGVAPVVTAYDRPPAKAIFDNIKVWESGLQ